MSEWIEVEDRAMLPTYARVPVCLDSGHGAWLVDAGGLEYLDLYAAHAAAVLGQAHAGLAAAIATQARRLTFYTSALYCSGRARAAARLVARAPGEGWKVFFTSSGAEANEAALRIARLRTGRRLVVAFEGAFHGRTLGSLAVTHGRKVRATAGVPLGNVAFLPFGEPPRIPDETAAVIVEPVQSMAGVRVAPPSFYAAVRAECARVGAAFVHDEVVTAPARTGSFLAAGWTGAVPDLVTCAKGIAGGFPCGATLVSPEWAAHLGPGDLGSTFGGGPLAMAALEATLDAVDEEDLAGRSAHLGERMRGWLERYDFVREVRGRGLLIGLVVEGGAAPLLAYLHARRILAGGSDDPAVVRIMPPLVVGEEDLGIFFDALDAYRPGVEPAGGDRRRGACAPQAS